MTFAALAPAMVLIIGFSGSVGWLRDPSPLLLVIACGMAVAFGLAFSRFQAPGAFAFSSVLSVGFVLLIAGRVVPGPAEALRRPILETLWFMNIRLLTFLSDVGRGLGELRSSSSPGGALATAAYGLLVWQTVYWLVWSSLRRRLAWPAVILCLALLVARDLLSARPPAWSMAMTFSVLVFAARASYAARIDSWERRGLGYPIFIWESWAASLAVIAVVVFIATGLTTPQWRDSIQRYLDSFRGPPDRTTQMTEAGGLSPRTSFVPDLAVVGAPFPKGGRTILYVRTSDSPTGLETGHLIEPPGEQHYWRGAIYETYTGRGWDLAPLGDTAAPMAGYPPEDLSRVPFRQEFEILDRGNERLFAASQPVAASSGVLLRTVGDSDLSTLLEGAVGKYSVVSWIPRVTQDQLTAAGTDYPEGIRATYLQLPSTLPERVRALASRISAGSASAFDEAVRIQGYLRSNFVYLDDPPPAPAGRDVVDYFLFEAPGGFCSYYATAMAVLLRLDGVPSRVVTGFATGDWEAREGRYRVTESHAHAWVEVYFPRYGWIEFEPTPSRPPFEYRNAPPPSADSAQRSSMEDNHGLLGRSASSLLRFVLVAAMAGLPVAFFVWRRRRGRPTPEELLHALYWRMRRTVSGDGRVHLTPGEFTARHEDRFAALPRLRRASQVLTSLYIQATYSPQAPRPDEVEKARIAWRSAWWDRARVRWRAKTA
jgi:transglutaminase-like putative cysteine protease